MAEVEEIAAIEAQSTEEVAIAAESKAQDEGTGAGGKPAEEKMDEEEVIVEDEGKTNESNEVADYMLDKINAVRQEQGLGLLVLDEAACVIASECASVFAENAGDLASLCSSAGITSYAGSYFATGSEKDPGSEELLGTDVEKLQEYADAAFQVFTQHT